MSIHGTDGMAAGPAPDPTGDDLLAAVFASLTAGLVVFDASLNVLHRNQAAASFFPHRGAIDAALNALALESTYEDWTTECRGVLRDGRARRFDVTVIQDDGGNKQYLALHLLPVRASQGEQIIGGVLHVEDTTTQISVERQLAVAQRLAAVGKLAARVAHELNNPLDGILRYTNLALRMSQNAGNARLEKYLVSARDGIVRMGDIITALLEFSRATPGTWEQATINKIVEDALQAMEGRAGEQDVTVVCHFHQTDMPVIRGSNLFQVFCNLIKNAIDAMPDGGTLTITTRLDDDDVIVHVDDTGIGLPDDVDRIYEPFFTTKAAGKGTGLGLAVCRELIEKFGGAIRAERLQPTGTRMTVVIPVANCTAFADRSPGCTALLRTAQSQRGVTS